MRIMLAVRVQHTRTGGVRRTRLRSRRRVFVLCSIDLDSMSVDNAFVVPGTDHIQ